MLRRQKRQEPGFIINVHVDALLGVQWQLLFDATEKGEVKRVKANTGRVNLYIHMHICCDKTIVIVCIGREQPQLGSYGWDTTHRSLSSTEVTARSACRQWHRALIW